MCICKLPRATALPCALSHVFVAPCSNVRDLRLIARAKGRLGLLSAGGVLSYNNSANCIMLLGARGTLQRACQVLSLVALCFDLLHRVCFYVFLCSVAGELCEWRPVVQDSGRLGCGLNVA